MERALRSFAPDASEGVEVHRQLVPHAVPPDPPASGPRLIRLLETEPDFAAGVDEERAAAARRHTVAPLLTLAPGAWSPGDLRGDDAVTGPFAVLVLSGLIARDVGLADRVATQLVGAGDAIPLGDWDDGSQPVHAAWWVAAAAEVAVLDGRFLAAAQRWPWLTARVVERALRWADRAAALQAMTQLGRVDLRLVALFWHLADRWGQMTPHGVVLPLRLTHEMLGRLVGAQRPTITLALRDLREQAVLRRRGAGWLLAAGSRELLEPQRDRVAADGAEIALVPEPPAIEVGQRLAAQRLRVVPRSSRRRPGWVDGIGAAGKAVDEAR
jgi:CRP/FNR family transcriptional regulator, cyclic AMP receptor protein